MENLNTKTEIENTVINHALSKDRFKEVVLSFKSFVKDKNNHPKKDEKYGTKYNFRITLAHFIVYAIIRNQDPSKVSHDPINSEYYSDVMKELKSMVTNYNPDRKSWRYRTFKEAFNISEEELNRVLSNYYN